MPLKEKLINKIKETQSEIKSLVKEYGSKVISEATVEQAYGGMRGIKCMVWETSLLDPMEGIRFRGYSIPEVREKLPKADGTEEPLPEGIFWLLLTGELPSK
ncbi:MAG: citrate (Si)-synthase, partial [candidate division Zixibacteria bacterium]|nr:citrate (Si)-synthase [candidate division Zixibacteria bacterium]